MKLSDRLRAWAQNEEMVDNHYTEHGKDCNEAADELDRFDSLSWEQRMSLIDY